MPVSLGVFRPVICWLLCAARRSPVPLNYEHAKVKPWLVTYAVILYEHSYTNISGGVLTQCKVGFSWNVQS